MSQTPAPRRPALSWLGVAVALGGACLPVDRAQPIEWAGYLVADPATGADLAGAPGARLEVTSADRATLLAEGQADDAGFLALSVPAATAAALRVSSEISVPTVFFTDTPAGDAAWLAGALFGRDAEAVEGLRARFSPEASPLTPDAGSAALWVEPLPDARWPEGALKVRGADGEQIGPSVSLRVSTAGSLTPVTEAGEGVDLVLFFDLPPGPIVLEVASTDGALRELPVHLDAGELGLIPRLPPTD